ncbi:MAG: hypothetical protein JXK07_04705 [Spirochaetes bacterium]|nr:hypothetical protein [Spirochaetota bacterium]MBN2772438.1 hypothetical protein [Spirochaetota bacterium]
MHTREIVVYNRRKKEFDALAEIGDYLNGHKTTVYFCITGAMVEGSNSRMGNGQQYFTFTGSMLY